MLAVAGLEMNVVAGIEVQKQCNISGVISGVPANAVIDCHSFVSTNFETKTILSLITGHN